MMIPIRQLPSRKTAKRNLIPQEAGTSKPAKPRKRIKYLEPDSSFLLNKLPNEILLYIMKLLSANDLLSLCRVGYKRLLELSYNMRKVAFLNHPKVLSEDISEFFSLRRPKCITEINFDYLYTTKPTVLFNAIKKCRFLKRLSLVECGLEFDHVTRLLQKCGNIEEFTWSCINPRTQINFFQRSPIIPIKSLKKLTMFLPYSDPESMVVLAFFTFVCFSLENVYLNCTENFNVVPYCATRMAVFRLRLPIVGQVLTVANYCSYDKCDIRRKEIFSKLMFAYKYYNFFAGDPASAYKRPKIFEKTDDMTLLLNESNYLQLTSKLDHLSVLPSIPSNSVSTLVFIMDENVVELTDEVMQSIVDVGGKKLKHLTLQDVSGDEIPSSYDSKSRFMCNGIRNILVDCLHLTSLTIYEFHFEIPFPYRSLKYAPRLERLTLPSCALVDFNCTDKGGLVLKVVHSSREIKHFTMLSCTTCERGPTDYEMDSLTEWEKLQHVSLMNITSFQSCAFLRTVADLCTNLKRVELVQLGHPDVCCFIQHVSYLILKAKNLDFLRLNQKAFHPENSFFWRCISMSKKLEGLCILTASEAVFDNRLVVEALKELPCLSLFHYVSRFYRNSLSRLVQKSMNDHGIENPRVEVRMLPAQDPTKAFRSVELPGCKYMHLQNL